MKTKQQRKDEAWKEYRKIADPALKECNKIIDHVYEAYKKIADPALKECKKKCKEIDEEGVKVGETTIIDGIEYRRVK